MKILFIALLKMAMLNFEQTYSDVKTKGDREIREIREIKFLALLKMARLIDS